MGNRLQNELDKILDACFRCETQNCCQCTLNFRKMEFETAIKQHNLYMKAKARKNRERPLKAHPRVVYSAS